MGICASKPKTKEIDLSQAPETPRAKGHTRDRSIDTNITIGSNRSQDLRTDEEKAQKQVIPNKNDCVPEENTYFAKTNNKFEEKSKKGKLTTEELNKLLLNIDPAEFEKSKFGEDDDDSEAGFYPESEPEVVSDTKLKYQQKLNQFDCIEEVTESFEETSEELLKNSSKVHLSSRASKSSDRLHSESGSLHDRIAITKDQISALEDLEKQLEEDIITISSSKGNYEPSLEGKYEASSLLRHQFLVDSGDTDFPISPRYENSYASLRNSPFPSQGSLDYERVSEYVTNSNTFSPDDHLMAEDDQFHEEGSLENLKYKSPEFKQRFVAGRDSILIVSQEFLDGGNNAENPQQSDTYQIMSKNSSSRAKKSDEQSETSNWKTTEPEKLAEKFGLEKFLERPENYEQKFENFEESTNEV